MFLYVFGRLWKYGLPAQLRALVDRSASEQYRETTRIEVVAPGADPKTIRLAFVGAENLAVDSQGDLVVTTGGGELRLHKPLVYQEIGGKPREVEGTLSAAPAKEASQGPGGFPLGGL